MIKRMRSLKEKFYGNKAVEKAEKPKEVEKPKKRSRSKTKSNKSNKGKRYEE